MNHKATLYRQAVTLAERGTPIAMVRLEWDAAAGKKVMAVPPPKGWHLQPPPTREAIEAMINDGCNAYLYRLPDGTWAVDSDSSEATQWCQQLGPPVTITPRGEHRLYAGIHAPGLPRDAPAGIDTSMRQLYGPGSFYDGPDGQVRQYLGEPVDFTAVPPMPTVLHAVGPFAELPGHVFEAASVAPTTTTSTATWDAHFQPAPKTQAEVVAVIKKQLAAIESGPIEGEAAYNTVRDASFTIGGYLHAGWFDVPWAAEKLEAACAVRWGSFDAAKDRGCVRTGLKDGDKPDNRLAVRTDPPAAATANAGLADRWHSRAALRGRPKPEPLVAGWADRGTLIEPYGEGGTFKTFALLDLFCCIALGIPWHGLAVTRGRCLYVAGEGSSGIDSRIEAWERGHDVPVGSVEIDVISGPVDIFAAPELPELIERMISIGYVATAFDTLNRNALGAEENSARDMALVIANLGRIQQATGATVFLPHHTTKDGGAARGNGAILWSTDSAWRFERDKDGGLVIINERQKDHEEGQKINLALVGEQISGSAYLVDSERRADSADPTNGAAGIPGGNAYDPFCQVPIGAELSVLAGKVGEAVNHLCQTVAANTDGGSSGTCLTKADIYRMVGWSTRNGSHNRAWNAVVKAGRVAQFHGTQRYFWEPWIEPKTP